MVLSSALLDGPASLPAGPSGSVPVAVSSGFCESSPVVLSESPFGPAGVSASGCLLFSSPGTPSPPVVLPDGLFPSSGSDGGWGTPVLSLGTSLSVAGLSALSGGMVASAPAPCSSSSVCAVSLMAVWLVPSALSVYAEVVAAAVLTARRSASAKALL